MAKQIAINPQRIEYMMELFGLYKRSNLLEIISKGLKNPVREEEVFSKEIKESCLKKVDKIFNKGLSFYTDPAPIQQSKSTSIFFRKNSFNSELNLGDREIVNKMESRIHSLSALCKLSNYSLKRKLPIYKLSDNPQNIAYKIREMLYPHQDSGSDRDFLKNLIKSFAMQNILVFEFVETWNKKNKTSIDGFFILPHAIAVKRNQKSLKREIFTLAHELGHYALEQEELDNFGEKEFQREEVERKNKTERWCDEFSFHFLMGKQYSQRMREIPDSRLKIDNGDIIRLSRESHVSRLALFTYLAATKRITWKTYYKIKDKLCEEYRIRREEENRKKELEKESGKTVGGGAPKPIFSPLEESIYTSAFYEGVVNEYDLLSHFKTKTVEEILYG